MVSLSGCQEDPFNPRLKWSIERNGKYIYATTRAGKRLSFESSEEIGGLYRVLDLKTNTIEQINDECVEAILWGVPINTMLEDRHFTASDVRQGEQFRLIPANDDIRKRLREKANDPKETAAKIEIYGERIQLLERDAINSTQKIEYFFLTDFKVTW
jgi:hypothetical protein